MATKAHSVLLPVILLTRASLSGVEPDCGLLLQVALHALQRVCFFGAVAVFSDFFVFCVFYLDASAAFNAATSALSAAFSSASSA